MSDDESTDSVPAKEQWQKVRDLLKGALLSNGIPADSKEMKPKQVWEKFTAEDHPALHGPCIEYGDKFTRTLRNLRNKHKSGDLLNEALPKALNWRKSAAKQALKGWFKDFTIAADYDTEGGLQAQGVWDAHCDKHRAFKRLKCNAQFIDRLKRVRDDYRQRALRCQNDLEAFNNAVQNHPTPALNHRGEPQWNGSDAQRFLTQDLKDGNNAGLYPEEFRLERPEYQVYSLVTFRDHIYQEQRLVKFRHYQDVLMEAKEKRLQY